MTNPVSRVTDEKIEEMLAGLEGVTPGPWGVWREPTFTQADAIRELTFQVESTPIADFAKAVYLLDAGGKCPATTGCGPSSAVNADHIARCDPDTMRSILTELQSLRALLQSQAAEIERCHKRLEIDRVYVGTEDDTFAEQVVPMHERPTMPDGIECRDSTISLLEADIERLQTLNADLIVQAQGHAQEARTANSTIYEIYQVLSGSKGEPGNWNGAEPARRYVEAAQSTLSEALEVVTECRSALAMMVDPKSIKGNSIPAAWATCAAAETRSRTFLSKYGREGK